MFTSIWNFIQTLSFFGVTGNWIFSILAVLGILFLAKFLYPRLRLLYYRFRPLVLDFHFNSREARVFSSDIYLKNVSDLPLVGTSLTLFPRKPQLQEACFKAEEGFVEVQTSRIEIPDLRAEEREGVVFGQLDIKPLQDVTLEPGASVFLGNVLVTPIISYPGYDHRLLISYHLQDKSKPRTFKIIRFTPWG